MGALEKVLVSLAVGILQWWASRNDIQKNERYRMALEAAKLAQKALEWKAGAISSPDGGASLRVAPGSKPIILPSVDPDPKSESDAGKVSDRG